MPHPVTTASAIEPSNTFLPCIHAISRDDLQIYELVLVAPPITFWSAPAQYSRHPPVDELHSIENRSLKEWIVFLTLLMGAVKHTRSLTVSKVFPVGGESGAQASSHRPSTELEVISESGNGSCWRPGTAVPRREGASSCISFQHGGVGGNKVWRLQKRQSLRSATPQVLDFRERIGPRAEAIRRTGRSGRTDLPDGLPAANWQAC